MKFIWTKFNFYDFKGSLNSKQDNYFFGKFLEMANLEKVYFFLDKSPFFFKKSSFHKKKSNAVEPISTFKSLKVF